jgi:hypothetical protein
LFGSISKGVRLIGWPEACALQMWLVLTGGMRSLRTF